ncbi:hypothetical protein PR202_ga21884 [Eleusine coracana subsp. coracana]|uniref:Uncharacterized protein n=1 Tax=Eleusine coracana subsp. coracana TaxID=191504 RepID=A0AAV5D242_ELECO|nr:hypothetical protein PR202_ga21884 [Eleusine coracana subsp. coracana]
MFCFSSTALLCRVPRQHRRESATTEEDSRDPPVALPPKEHKATTNKDSLGEAQFKVGPCTTQELTTTPARNHAHGPKMIQDSEPIDTEVTQPETPFSERAHACPHESSTATTDSKDKASIPPPPPPPPTPKPLRGPAVLRRPAWQARPRPCRPTRRPYTSARDQPRRRPCLGCIAPLSIALPRHGGTLLYDGGRPSRLLLDRATPL